MKRMPRSRKNQKKRRKKKRKRSSNCRAKNSYNVFNYTRRGLLDADKLTVVSLMALKILVRSGKVGKDEADMLIRAPPDSNPPPMPENARSWLTEMQWAQMRSLESMEAFKKGG